LPGDAVVKGALSGAQRLSTSHNSIEIGKSLPGDAVVKGALSGAQRLSTSHNSIEIGKSLPGDVVVKGALCGTPKTLYFTHLHSNGKKYINCISGKNKVAVPRRAYGT
jgi:hypothetical protein